MIIKVNTRAMHKIDIREESKDYGQRNSISGKALVCGLHEFDPHIYASLSPTRSDP